MGVINSCELSPIGPSKAISTQKGAKLWDSPYEPNLLSVTEMVVGDSGPSEMAERDFTQDAI
jgi:hypothetical protein